ncbi:MAG: (4Fe-4S)-binding protein [Micropruina sp.]|nr:(4Fe-4S)-binding protein [Micropruina sp.]
MTSRNYTGPLVDVSFDGAICQHSEECMKGMPLVFDVSARPWINPSRAETSELASELRTVVGRCPSGALQIHDHQDSARVAAEQS